MNRQENLISSTMRLLIRTGVKVRGVRKIRTCVRVCVYALLNARCVTKAEILLLTHAILL